MIKIDLGKEDSDKPKSKASAAFSKLTSKMPKGSGGSNSSLDIHGVGVLVFASLLASLPYFFVESMKEKSVTEHKRDMKVISTKSDTIKLELSKFASFEAEMKSYEEQKTRIMGRIETVNQLLKTRKAPVNVLDAIGQALPQRAWLTALDFASAPIPKLTFSGKAFSNEDVSDFLDRITESAYLNDVNLENVTPIRVENATELKAFEVSAAPRDIGAAQIVPDRQTAAKENVKGAKPQSVKTQLPIPKKMAGDKVE